MPEYTSDHTSTRPNINFETRVCMAATIQSLDRGLKILDILGKAGRPLTLNELAEHFSIDRSSVFRLVNTLVQNSFVIQHADTKQYSIGYKVLELSGALWDSAYIEDLIRPVMRRVLALTGQNTHLAVLDKTEVIFLAVERPRDHFALNISVGAREPAVVTALGRSLLAFLQEGELEKLLEGFTFRAYTQKSVTSLKQLKKVLSRVHAEQIAFDDEEYRPGIVCLAAPVFNHSRTVRYSIGISGLRETIHPRLEEYRSILKQAGTDASQLMGYKPEE